MGLVVEYPIRGGIMESVVMATLRSEKTRP
jgi:hypothetical protein